MSQQPLIGFAGMSHLGINTAVATAERGFDTICYDSDSFLIKDLKNQKLTIVEPGLSTLFTKHLSTQRLKFSDDVSRLQECDIVYISSDVMTNDSGESDLSTMRSLIEYVCWNLKPNAILIVLAQVPPGFTRQLKELIHPDRLYYQVETLIFGKAIERAMHPERFIIGCADADRELNPFYQRLLNTFNCPILVMNYESAELTKISINCYLAAQVSVTNILSEICEKMGANWSQVIPALKLDKRIGQYSYIMPGLGIAGGNLERDLTTILNLSKEWGTENSVVKSFVDNNRYRKNWVLKILHQSILLRNPNPSIAVLGLTYKENTNSTKNSPALALLESLKTYNIQSYDPTIKVPIVSWARCAHSIDEAVQNVDVLIIMTPWEEFKSLTPDTLKNNMHGKIIIDPYHALNEIHFLKEGFQYFALGRGSIC
ncbi:MAG: hypothetical protein ACD_45C00181G0005 [uncultured bacterium]|nr:MAG: hypothetical protein ACD_45C00181G0005 [uncultured bacterium]